MRSVEPGKRPDIFAAAECGVTGSKERVEHRAYIVTTDMMSVPRVLLTNRMGVLVLLVPTVLRDSFCSFGTGHDLQRL